MSDATGARFTVDDNSAALGLFGRGDENLKLIEQAFPVKIVPRGNELNVTGAGTEVDAVIKLLGDLLRIARKEHYVTPQDVRYGIELLRAGSRVSLRDVVGSVVCTTARGRPIMTRTLGQQQYVEAIKKNEMVFCIGPAGTGKTYLAIAAAVEQLKTRSIGRIVLARPAVEAGEKLGFLPGDLQEKVDPYLRPLYDAMFDILGAEAVQKYMDRGTVEVAPLAYMRGRTLDNSFIILDEAQNTTPRQMKMFVTRMGLGSKAVITGDVTQVDLPPGQSSGLLEAKAVLSHVKGIEFVYLRDADVVRHDLVQRIVRAYERLDMERSVAGGTGGPESAETQAAASADPEAANALS